MGGTAKTSYKAVRPGDVDGGKSTMTRQSDGVEAGFGVGRTDFGRAGPIGSNGWPCEKKEPDPSYGSRTESLAGSRGIQRVRRQRTNETESRPFAGQQTPGPSTDTTETLAAITASS